MSGTKRNQFYLDEETAKARAALSRKKGRKVSDFVRENVRGTYMSKNDVDKAQLARQLSGIWRNRKDLNEFDRLIRRLRKGTRLKRLGLG
jgi:hypothetical protein